MSRNIAGNLMIVATIALAGSTLAQGAAGQTAGERWRDCDECPEIVAVPAGMFMMGSPASEDGRYEREGPTRLVTIARPFAIGVYEVTRAVMENLDDFRSLHPAFANLDPANMITNGLSAPIHAGAAKYYAEQGW